VGAVEVSLGAVLARAGVIAFTRIELVALSVDGSAALDGDIFGGYHIEEHNVAVAGRDAFPGAVSGWIAAAQEAAGWGEVEG
jgi:hypothetical protein